MKNNRELDEVLAETREKYSVDRLRKLYIDRDPTVEALLRRIAFTARREFIDMKPFEQANIGFDLFIGDPRILAGYAWWK